jgi:multidrug efflux pump subunit AcrA (membrane-fusion protein)
MTNKLAAGLLAGFGLLIASCSSAGEANPEEKPAVRASTEILQSGKVSDFFQAPGTVRARTSTELSSQVVGQILSLTVREGDRVSQGQVVVEIDNRQAASQLRRARGGLSEAQLALEEAERSIGAAMAAVRAAEANRDLAASTQKRYDLLRERRSVSLHEYDEIEARYKAAQSDAERAQQSLAAANARRSQTSARIEQAEAEVEAAQVAAGYTKVVSPINGIVTSRAADPGMLATPGTSLLTIEDDGQYELEVAVEESRTGRIGIGQTARIEIDALQDVALEGRVREIVPSSDPATRTYIVKLTLPTPPRDRVLRSGFFGRAFFPDSERHALLVPEAAVIRRGQLEGVYIVENNVALLRLVKTGRQYDKSVEIISGLSPGARIITAPTAAIADGVRVVGDASPGTTP